MGASDININPKAQFLQAKLANSHDQRRKRSSKRRNVTFILRRNWSVPLILLLGFLSIYAINPTQSNPIHRFIFLFYKLQDDGPLSTPAQYGKGPWDMAFVCFYTIFLTFTRELCMQELLIPWARYCGIKRAKRTRFGEQVYTAIYIAFIGPWGMYVMSRSPVWYFNTHGMYEAFPHRTHDAWFKCYYLFQAAFWVQQVVVMMLGLEERRKDFKELIAHHVVTVVLIALSYRFHFTYVGIAVYISHDISDFFLAIAKSLNYLDSKFQGPFFGVCVTMWIYLRHYINLRILYSMLPGSEFSTIGPYELNWEAQQYKSPLSNVIAFGLLAALQALNLFWLYCLLRSAYRLVFMGIAKDDRSEAEEDVVVPEPVVDVVKEKLPRAEGLVHRKNTRV